MPDALAHVGSVADVPVEDFAGTSPRVVSEEQWKAYLEQSESFAADRFRSERRAKRLAYGLCCVLAIGQAGSGVGAGAIALTQTHHLFVVDRNPATGEVRLLDDLMGKMGFARDPYALVTDNRVLEDYVRKREGWNPAEATASFDAVGCMSDREGEQKSFDRWYHGEEGPQGVYLKLGRGYREIKINAPAITEALSGNNERRVSAPISVLDHVNPGQPPAVRQGRVEFTVRRDHSYASHCNIRALVVKDYVRQIYRSPGP